MPKKRAKARTHGPSTQGGLRRLKSVRSPTVELAGLRGSFLAWLRIHGLPPHVDLAALWGDAVATVDLAVARAGLTDLHSWTAEQIDALADLAVARAGLTDLHSWTAEQIDALADLDKEDADALAVLPLLLAFLGDTGRWNGTPDQLDAAITAAEETTSPVEQVLAELADVQVDPAAEDAALRALPVVAQAEALLRFVLPRRPVTATGALRRADIPAAAGLVGTDLGGRTPQSMWDVARLSDLWPALRDIGLLVVTPSEATLAPLAHGWVSGNAEEARQARPLVVAGYLATLFSARPDLPWVADPVDTLLPIVAAPAVGRPLPTSQALGDAGAFLDSPARADVTPHAGPAGSDATLLAALTAIPARMLAQQLADEGFVEISDTISAAPGLHRVLAAFATAVLRAEQQLDAAGRGVLDLPERDPDLAGHAYRLRIELAGARPPVWREALVDPGIPLDELHEVIQALFGWEDAHLHEFTAVGPDRRTMRFGPPDDGWRPPIEAAADESLVRLSRLIGPRQGKLRYRYDFGDDWDHLITVTGSQPAEGTSLPRCTAGAGAAPHEDSGGVWGWADKVQAARDPRHPEHSDIRDWLGLEDGEMLEPDAFDLAETDGRLAGLRRAGRTRTR